MAEYDLDYEPLGFPRAAWHLPGVMDDRTRYFAHLATEQRNSRGADLDRLEVGTLLPGSLGSSSR